MIDPPIPANEQQRLDALRATCLLDTPIEKRFDRITRLAQVMLDVPIAAISLVDEDRQWFKSIQGLDASETSRQVAFCAHTIVDEKLQVVPDARVAERFCQNPLVTGEPGIVFYAGHPLQDEAGAYLGSLCVIDYQPRELSDYQTKVLGNLAKLAEQEIQDPQDGSGLREFLERVERCDFPSLVDPNTRLWNRDGIEAVLDFVLDQTRDAGQSLGIMRVELGDLPSICESGDETARQETLRSTAKTLVNLVRPQDVVGDLGDGRFVLVVRTPDPYLQSLRYAERLEHPLMSAKRSEPGDLIASEVRTETKIYTPNASTRAAMLLDTGEVRTARSA